MQFKSVFVAVAAMLTSQFTIAQKHKVGAVRAYNKTTIPAPAGMVYVPGGSVVMKYTGNNIDSSNYKVVSLSPFFIDKTEISNREYRDFVNWVIDSVAITQYIKDDKYFLDKKRDSTSKAINWSKVKGKQPLWQSKNSDIQNKIAPMMEHDNIRTGLVNYTYTYYRQENGTKEGKYVTETINIYPDTKVWSTDFPNSQTDMMVQAYFRNSSFDEYPVVGVNWKQAKAFAHWRTKVSGYGKGSKYMLNYQLPYSLPSEAQWVYAAAGDQKLEDIARDTALMNRDGKYLNANFKQGEGDYTEDGSSYTVHVMAYAPNQFGLYNMIGNVSEWTLDAYNESAGAFVHDQNPVLLYDADDKDAEVMKRKVIRGGSWKDNASALSPYSRTNEVQDVCHSYIGFRCVMPAPEILTKEVQSRKYKKKSKRNKNFYTKSK